MVNSRPREGDIDSEGGGVVVGPEAGLALRVVLHYKVHGSMTLVKTIESHGNHMTTSLAWVLPWSSSQGRPSPAQEPRIS